MIWTLRIFFIVVLVSMLSVTTWASLQVPLWETPRAVVLHPWFVATLFDTYWGFFTFYLWVLHKETSNAMRVVWLVAIVLLGNIAMSIFALIQLFRVPADARIADVLLRKTEF